MTNARSTKSSWAKQAALGGACALALLAGMQSIARAEDDDEANSIWNLDTRMYQEFMGALGLKNGHNDAIEYRERSPLVVPPSRTLPPPETVRPQANGAWPVDPDQKRRKELAAAKRNKKPTSDVAIEGLPLLPSELDRPGARTASSPAARTTNGNGDPDGAPVLPSKLGYIGGLFSNGLGFTPQKDEVGTFTREPERNSLTAPPPGYQTPSPAAPYGVTKRIEYGTAIKTEDIAVGR